MSQSLTPDERTTMEQLARKIIEQMRQGQQPRTPSPATDKNQPTILLDKLYRNPSFKGFMNSLPRGGGPREFDTVLKKIMPTVCKMMGVSDDKSTNFTVIAASAFFAQIMEDDPDLCHVLLLIVEGQADDDMEKALSITAALSFALFFLNWRANGGRIYLRGGGAQ